MVPRFLERYRTHYLLRDPELRLFDGVPEMLDALAGQGIQLAVATGKSRIGLNRALAATGLGPGSRLPDRRPSASRIRPCCMS